LFDHPLTSRIQDEELSDIRKNLRSIEKGMGAGNGPISYKGAALQYLYSRDQRAYPKSEYVLRRSLTVSQQSVDARAAILRANYAVDAIWPTDFLSFYESIPSDLLFSIDNIPHAAGPIVALEQDWPTNMQFYWGWLKKSYSITQSSGGKYTISQEWWLDWWNDYSTQIVRVLGDPPSYMA
jgi:hypothetical protein